MGPDSPDEKSKARNSAQRNRGTLTQGKCFSCLELTPRHSYSLKTKQLSPVMNFHPFSNFILLISFQVQDWKLGGMWGPVLSEIFLNVLISFFGRSPGSRYMQNHRISCHKYVSSELMRSKRRQTSPLLIKLCFPSPLYPRQPPPILLTPSGLPGGSEAGGDGAWHTILPPPQMEMHTPFSLTWTNLCFLLH